MFICSHLAIFSRCWNEHPDDIYAMSSSVTQIGRMIIRFPIVDALGNCSFLVPTNRWWFFGIQNSANINIYKSLMLARSWQEIKRWHQEGSHWFLVDRSCSSVRTPIISKQCSSAIPQWSPTTCWRLIMVDDFVDPLYIRGVLKMRGSASHHGIS